MVWYQHVRYKAKGLSMKDMRVIVLVGAICILIGMFGITIMRDWPRLTGKQQLESPTAKPTAVPTVSLYSDWKLFRNGYAFPLPPDWNNTSDNGGTAVLEPGQTLGSITKISVTILSDAKAPQGQQFTTQTEFNQWYAVSGQVQGTMQKPANMSLDGEKAVMLMDTKGATKSWVGIVWARKDNINIYITFNGSGEYSNTDENAINYIVSKFMFTPPPSAGAKSKE